ncbi:Nuclear nucleic acid-binding protein C1D [Mycena venus]|uniref:Exosome complex protein n=1 Tax=Mycena venus TaxID=2733690 RepID=A0A8H6XW12_9AGAR|nr:Nuclear nucleic acid-binding protein C1D [Mycena venus]
MHSNQASPRFSRKLSPETTVALAPIEQAKLQTLLPYIVYDLVFIYLKSKGIDPKTHPVVGELTRVRKYFDKISSAESPDAQRAPLDKAAATRFIKHAITQSKLGEAAAAAEASKEPEPSTFVPVKVTSKMVERAEYEAELRERGDASSSDEELEVIDGDDAPPTVSGKGKGKAKEVVDEPVSAGSKRRRPAIDPFAGFGDEPQTEEADEVEKKKRKKEKKKAKKADEDDTQTPSTQTEEMDDPEKKRRKKEKKKVKKGDGDETPSPKKKGKK